MLCCVVNMFGMAVTIYVNLYAVNSQLNISYPTPDYKDILNHSDLHLTTG